MLRERYKHLEKSRTIGRSREPDCLLLALFTDLLEDLF
jgi:hypothetical protein